MQDDLSEAFDVLGLGDEVGLEELEAAWAERRALYAEDSLATYALLSSEEREAQLAEIEAAYRKVKHALEAEAARLKTDGEDGARAPASGSPEAVRPAPEVDPQGSLALPLTPPASKPAPAGGPADEATGEAAAKAAHGRTGPGAERGPAAKERPASKALPAPAADAAKVDPRAGPARKAVSLPPEDLEAPGAYLEACRDRLGLTLREVADRTRIRATHLENIEAENFDALPPAVYVRGFVLQYARELGVARPDALAGAFLERCRRARPDDC